MENSNLIWLHIISVLSGIMNAGIGVIFMTLVMRYQDIIPFRRRLAMTTFASSAIMITPMYLFTTNYIPLAYFVSRIALLYLIWDLTAPLLFPKRYEYIGPLRRGKINSKRPRESTV